MGSDFGFDIFKERVRLKGSLQLLSGLHIGAGRTLGVAGSDLPVLRDFGGNPFIPGSSLKGVIRSNLEAWLRAFAPSFPQWLACDPTHDDWRCISSTRKRRIIERLGSDADAKLWRQSCWICRLFGSPWLASKIQVMDLPVTGAWRPEWMMVRDGVVIDRESETAAPHLKYDFEAVPAGTQFELEILVENAEAYQMGLLIVALDLLNAGFALLGGSTSRGLGRVSVSLHDIQVITPESVLDMFCKEKAPSEARPAIEEETEKASDLSKSTLEDDTNDPVRAVLACLEETGGLDHGGLVSAMQARGWNKARLQGTKYRNWTELFDKALKTAKVVRTAEGCFCLPGGPGGVSDQNVAEKEERHRLQETQRHIERRKREWREALKKKMSKEEIERNSQQWEEFWEKLEKIKEGQSV